MRIVCLVGQKGGVGKTTTTMNLAAVMAKHSRVLVVDVDPQKSTTWWAENAGDNLPFDFAADVDPENIARLRELPYDTIFVDTPGSLEDTRVLSAVLDASDFVILPLNPEPLNPEPVPLSTPEIAPIEASEPPTGTSVDEIAAPSVAPGARHRQSHGPP